MQSSFRNILVAAANTPAQQLRIDQEIRVIEKHIRDVYAANQYRLLPPLLAVRADDFHKRLMQTVPHILHFSGHGAAEDGLHFVDPNGYPVPVSGEKLSGLFALINKNLRLHCVVLNACWSDSHATSIHQFVPYVIGMQKDIDDGAALEFSDGFYGALSAGKTIEEAFEHGKISVHFEQLPDSQVPRLLINHVLLKQVRAIAQIQNAADEKQKAGANMSDKKPQGDRNVSIGGNASGNVIVTGDQNITTYRAGDISTGAAIPVEEILDSLRQMKTELAELRLSRLAKKELDNGLEEAEIGLQEKKVDKKQVGSAVEKALKAAGQSEEFLQKSIGIAGHVKKIVGWLGNNWQHLLTAIA